MRSLAPPAIDHRNLYTHCVERTQPLADRATLTGLSDLIVRAGVDFSTAGQAQNLHSINPLALSPNEKSLVKPLYGARLVGGRGRWAYDRLKNSSKICPYCTFGEVYELDHFLSKTDYPELNICPSNLIPVCHPCNHIKGESAPLGGDRYFLHPYFDKLPNIPWLFASLDIQANGPVLNFRVDLSTAIYGNLSRRLKYHFEALQLDRRFQEHAAQVLVEIESDLVDLLAPLGQAGVSDHFRNEADRHFRRHGNSLEAAAYLSASNNPDFCSGQYRN